MPGCQVPSLALGEGVVDRDVDPLEHRGQHAAGVQVVLVAVDADRQLALVGRRLQHAQAGGAGRGVDHVGTLAELADGELAAARRVVPGRGRGAGVVHDHLGVRVHVLDALLVAVGEVADQRDVHAADEADLAGLGGQRRRHADQEAALVLLEHHRLRRWACSTTKSMITNFLSGNSAAIVSSGVEKAKPTATTMSARCAMRRSAWSRWLSLVISNSR